jgi:Ca-activated chloride channel homolog
MLKVCSRDHDFTFDYVPLTHVNIDSTVRSFAADIHITYVFRHDRPRSIEAVFYFPLDDQAVIYDFIVRIDDREIVAQISNTRMNERTSNMERIQDDKSLARHLRIPIGRLQAGQQCRITISYVIELDFLSDYVIRFVIPKTIVSNCNHCMLPDDIYQQQQHLSNGYHIEFQCRTEKLIGSNGKPYITRLNSLSHSIHVDYSMANIYLVRFIQTYAQLDRDILLDIQWSHKRTKRSMTIESHAAMAMVIPFANETSSFAGNNEHVDEFIFLLDCSSSMRNENKIHLTRQAMLFFMTHLPSSSYFNIILFGCVYRCLFNQTTVACNLIHVRLARKFIDQIRADLGSTDLVSVVLQHSCPSMTTIFIRLVSTVVMA